MKHISERERKNLEDLNTFIDSCIVLCKTIIENRERDRYDLFHSLESLSNAIDNGRYYKSEINRYISTAKELFQSTLPLEAREQPLNTIKSVNDYLLHRIGDKTTVKNELDVFTIILKNDIDQNNIFISYDDKTLTDEIRQPFVNYSKKINELSTSLNDGNPFTREIAMSAQELSEILSFMSTYDYNHTSINTTITDAKKLIKLLNNIQNRINCYNNTS